MPSVPLRFEAISVFQTQRSTSFCLAYFSVWFSNSLWCVRVCVWERKILWCDMWDLVVVWQQEKVLWSYYYRLDTMCIGLWCWHWAGRSRDGDCLKSRPWDKKGWTPLPYKFPIPTPINYKCTWCHTFEVTQIFVRSHNQVTVSYVVQILSLVWSIPLWILSGICLPV